MGHTNKPGSPSLIIFKFYCVFISSNGRDPKWRGS